MNSFRVSISSPAQSRKLFLQPDGKEKRPGSYHTVRMQQVGQEVSIWCSDHNAKSIINDHPEEGS